MVACVRSWGRPLAPDARHLRSDRARHVSTRTDRRCRSGLLRRARRFSSSALGRVGDMRTCVLVCIVSLSYIYCERLSLWCHFALVIGWALAGHEYETSGLSVESHPACHNTESGDSPRSWGSFLHGGFALRSPHVCPCLSVIGPVRAPLTLLASTFSDDRRPCICWVASL